MGRKVRPVPSRPVVKVFLYINSKWLYILVVFVSQHADCIIDYRGVVLYKIRRRDQSQQEFDTCEPYIIDEEVPPPAKRGRAG